MSNTDTKHKHTAPPLSKTMLVGIDQSIHSTGLAIGLADQLPSLHLIHSGGAKGPSWASLHQWHGIPPAKGWHWKTQQQSYNYNQIVQTICFVIADAIQQANCSAALLAVESAPIGYAAKSASAQQLSMLYGALIAGLSNAFVDALPTAIFSFVPTTITARLNLKKHERLPAMLDELSLPHEQHKLDDLSDAWSIRKVGFQFLAEWQNSIDWSTK